MEVSVYWWVERMNFGDLLTPLLLKHYGLTPVHNPYIEVADVICIGSVLQALPAYYRGCIAGAGLIEDRARRFPDADILGVRGELTRQRIGAPADTILGDPGLLCSLLMPGRESKRFALGIVPHYVDLEAPAIKRLSERYPQDVRVVDPCREPLAVLQEIDACAHILSSSLHGKVAADSLGIPSRWVTLSDGVHGGGFKFHDYFSAFGCDEDAVGLDGDEALIQLLGITNPPPGGVDDRKAALDCMFTMLRGFYPSRWMSHLSSGDGYRTDADRSG